MRRAAARLAGAFGAPPALTRRRVVVTGIGFVSPLGCGSGGRGTGGPVWASLLSGASGVRALAPADLRGAGDAVSLLGRLPCRIAGVVPRCGPGALDAAFEADAYNGAARLADFSLYAVSAARSAVADAAPGLVDSYGAGRVGASLGTGIGSLSSIVAAGAQVASGSERRVSPYFVPTILGNMAAAHVSLAHGLRGPQLAATTACAASAHAIGEAYRCVRDGGADAMLAGGSEGSIDALALVGFSRLRALSRPFDAERDGFVMGEGAAVLVLEEMEAAIRRGAHVYAELRGYGSSADAHHITQPSADGSGAAAAMRAALDDAGLSPLDVDYVNAHATSTPQGDAVEVRAVADVLGRPEGAHAPLLMSSAKGAIGHLLGAAGAVEAAFAALSVATGRVPHTLNLAEPEPEIAEAAAAAGVRLVAGEPEAPGEGVRAALSNSFGFGGTNAALCFSHL